MTAFPASMNLTSQIHWKSNLWIQKSILFRYRLFCSRSLGHGWFTNYRWKFKRTVNRFREKNVILSWGNSIILKEMFGMSGLPYIEDTYMDIQAEDIRNQLLWYCFHSFAFSMNLHHSLFPENLLFGKWYLWESLPAFPAILWAVIWKYQYSSWLHQFWY